MLGTGLVLDRGMGNGRRGRPAAVTRSAVRLHHDDALAMRPIPVPSDVGPGPSRGTLDPARSGRMLGAIIPTESERSMQTEGDDATRDTEALERALDDALAGLPDVDRAAFEAPPDYHWLSAGMRLGLERPDQARHLLEMIGAGEADRVTLLEVDVPGVSPADGRSTASPDGSVPVPVSSSLLARAAALPSSERTGLGPEVAFGWAGRLSPGEILSLGRVVGQMLAAGSPPDVGRGFGIAWDAGVRLPRKEHEVMFRDFTELEVTVAGILTGRDLRTGEPAPRKGGLGAIFGQWVSRPEESRAAAALESGGEAARHGLVALWNVWMAMRYRSLIPNPTFELLVHPWVTVVGPLPPP